jgi:YbgC/YbaW family acyl-CoA thioester hydrolase
VPETPPLYEHHMARRVQFHETDAAGLVHFSRFFNYLEEAEHALWRAAGLSIHPPGTEVRWPRLATGFEFHEPLHFEDEFDVHIRVEDMARSTIRYSCRVTRGETHIATGSLTIICVSKRPDAPMKAIRIPEAVTARLCPAPTEAR